MKYAAGRRSFSYYASRTLGASSLIAAMALGCSSARPPAPAAGKAAAQKPAAAPVAQADPAASPGVREQREAQRSWCVYLEALYLRAAEGAKSWPKFQQCVEATTMAAPAMLRATAECSLQALQAFQGDPFTAAYAAEVSRCGVEALDATIVTQRDLAPYVATLCGRLVTCGNVDYTECRASLEEGLGPHLERAVGALNERGRTRLQACLKTVTCDEIGDQITACLEPIMDGLLWLPG